MLFLGKKGWPATMLPSSAKLLIFCAVGTCLGSLVWGQANLEVRANLVQPFTRNLEEIQNKLAFTQSKGRTALLDAVYMAMHEMKKAKNPRKALLLISDGGDNSSRYSEAEIKALVKEADVQIYAIGIYESMGSRNRTPEETSGPALLTEISEQTGGRQYQVDNLNEL